MAIVNTFQLARLLKALQAGQSQGSLASQAADCAQIVEALGYYDLGDHLRHMAENGSFEQSKPEPKPEPEDVIHPTTVMVYHVDHNWDIPGLNWLVSLTHKNGFGVEAGAFKTREAAEQFAADLQILNGWDLKVKE